MAANGELRAAPPRTHAVRNASGMDAAVCQDMPGGTGSKRRSSTTTFEA